MVVFEIFLKMRLRLGKLCNGSRLVRMYIKCWTFENISCFESVCCVFVLKVSKDVRFESEKATKNVSTYSKVFVHFFLPLILISYN